MAIILHLDLKKLEPHKYFKHTHHSLCLFTTGVQAVHWLTPINPYLRDSNCTLDYPHVLTTCGKTHWVVQILPQVVIGLGERQSWDTPCIPYRIRCSLCRDINISNDLSARNWKLWIVTMVSASNRVTVKDDLTSRSDSVTLQ